MTVGIVWFRQDLRVADNAALADAVALCEHILAVYIYAPEEAHPNAPGAASRWWLHHTVSLIWIASFVRSDLDFV